MREKKYKETGKIEEYHTYKYSVAHNRMHEYDTHIMHNYLITNEAS